MRNRLPEYCDGRRENRTIYRIVQMIPAPPGAYAIFREDDGKTFFRTPVVAWGLWDEWEAAPGGQRVSRLRRCAGPLTLGLGRLEPAESNSDYHGCRVGGFVESADGHRFDDPAEGEEPSEPQSMVPDLGAALANAVEALELIQRVGEAASGLDEARLRMRVLAEDVLAKIRTARHG